MSALEALWLGIVQGLTEFLPVSSSGHLVMLREAFGAERESGLLFEIAVHVATLVAIVIFYRRRIATLVMGGLGHGSGAHGPNEYMIIEPKEGSTVAGLAEIEKGYVDLLFALAGK